MAELLAQQGEQPRDEFVSGFIAYVAQFDHEFPQRLKGATDEEISRLEEVARRPLPHQYRDFLRHIGNGRARLVFAGECQTNIFYVTKYHQRRRDNGPDPDIPAGYFVIGTACLSSDPMCLDCRSEQTQPVVVMEEGVPGFYAASLLHLLYCRGFTAYRLPSMPQFQCYTSAEQSRSEPQSFERILGWAAAGSWTRQWFSDSYSLCVEGTRTAFCLTHYSNGGYSLHLGGGVSSDLPATALEISQVLGVALNQTPLDEEE